MESTEILVAHLDEALTLAGSSQLAKRRLALLLIDSAVELMMYRETKAALDDEEIVNQLIDMTERIKDSGAPLPLEVLERHAKMLQWVTPPKRRREIVRYFDAKASFIEEKGLLTSQQVRALKKLHKYRNEAYHRDRIRPATLDSALLAYSYIACTLLQKLPVRSIGSNASNASFPTVASYLGADFRQSFDAHERIGAAMLARDDVIVAAEIGRALSAHVLDRLAALDESLEYVANWISSIREGQEWTKDDILSLTQIDEDQLYLYPEVVDVRAAPVLATRATIDDWTGSARDLADESDEIQAFGKFADLEDALEPIELRVEEMVETIDDEIQRQIDIARGK